MDKQRFEELCKIEPRLGELLADAISVPAKDDGEVERAWYGPGGFKERLTKLVGWHAEKPELRETSDYGIAYEAIYYQMPNFEEEDKTGDEDE